MELAWAVYREVGRGLPDFQGLMTVGGVERTSRVRGSAGKKPPASREDPQITQGGYKPSTFPRLGELGASCLWLGCLGAGPNIGILVVYGGGVLRGWSKGIRIEQSEGKTKQGWGLCDWLTSDWPHRFCCPVEKGTRLSTPGQLGAGSCL